MLEMLVLVIEFSRFRASMLVQLLLTVNIVSWLEDDDSRDGGDSRLEVAMMTGGMQISGVQGLSSVPLQISKLSRLECPE
ncbi:hypothetical protein OJ252_3176 [Cryptosporidium canis]|uniref:Uncharacterized protein n=1 Tax=Cryptosporidium canis TaxID=195482 RepID=A0ABQ8P356_9CRYT|nr:hypothetical protein OJ252_3176 [Cryptosporidium canis]